MATSYSTPSSTTPAPSSISNLPKEEQEALKAAVFQRLHPRTYFERFLVEKVRPDGREFGEWRQVSIVTGSISTADGSALVRMGDTTIVCGVKAEIAEPDIESPNDGFLVPNLDLPAICSPKFKPGPPSEEAQVLSERLNEVLVTSGILPLESLCIEPGKSAWVLYLDATCLNYDGNVFDAALLAMIAALKNARLPSARWEEFEEGTGRTLCSRRELKSLQITHTPISMSFGIFDSKHILSDPTSFEEPLLDTTLSIVIDENDHIISVSQLGLGTSAAAPSVNSSSSGLSAGISGEGANLGQDTLMSCISEAKRRRVELAKKI